MQPTWIGIHEVIRFRSVAIVRTANLNNGRPSRHRLVTPSDDIVLFCWLVWQVSARRSDALCQLWTELSFYVRKSPFGGDTWCTDDKQKSRCRMAVDRWKPCLNKQWGQLLSVLMFIWQKIHFLSLHPEDRLFVPMIGWKSSNLRCDHA